MSFSEPFIRRPVATSLLMVGLLLLGLVAYRFLPVAPLPQVEFPTIVVSASLPGASPETMAATVAAPLERRLGAIAGASEITSSSATGTTSVVIQFELSRSIEGAAKDVQAAINAAVADLPGDLPSLPRFRKVNPADAPVMILALTSDVFSSGEVYNYADTVIGQRLSQVKGVSQVTIGGAEKTAVRVRVNPGAVANMGLGFDDIRTAITQANADAPKGSFDGEDQSFSLGVNDQLFTAEEYAKLIVGTRNGTPIRLDAVASVIDGAENTRVAGWYNRDRAVIVLVQKQAGANVIETVDGVLAALPQLERWLPPSIKVSIVNDRTRTIRASVHDVQRTLAIAIVLVVLVVFFFLRRVRATLIPGVAIPLALAGTFAIMYAAGYSLDTLSLMALTISVGFVVDDAIIVLENVHRHIEEGETPFQAALHGARQVGFTVLSMSLSLCSVFIPILFMGGVIGRMFREFAGTLSAAIAVSTLVSLTLTPMMCAKLLKPERAERKRGILDRGAERIFTATLAEYERGLLWALRHRWIMLLVTVGTIGASIWLYTIVPKGFIPAQDTGILIGTTEAPSDISFIAMAERQQKVAEAILSDPGVASLTSSIGGTGFGPSAMSNGRLFVNLKPISERQIGVDALVARLRPKLARVDGIITYLQPGSDVRVGARQAKAAYQFTLQDADLAELLRWAPLVLDRLRQVPELTDVGSDRERAGLQMTVAIDRDAAARLGVLPQAVDDVLYNAFGQRQISTMYADLNQYHVVLEIEPQYQLDPSALSKAYVKTNAGRLVPLSAVAHFETTTTPLAISHQGQLPAVTISFNLAPGLALSDATLAVNRAMLAIGAPASLIGTFEGTARAFRDSLSTQPMLIATALLTIYILLGVLYESMIHPITILSTIPSAGVGALVAILVTHGELSIISMIGIVLLIGIVKKNAIMMIDYALEAERRDGLAPEAAIHRACIVRFRPIMMTTMAALLGAVPLVLGQGSGAELRHPLGVAVIGGLLLSQFLTLYTTPVVYLTFERLASRRRGWAASRRALPQPAE
jgi:hydrophobe/amphiphile efflux-1 (HAE1) family protein